MAAAKDVDLSLSNKVKIFKELEAAGATQVQVAKQFGVSMSQISRIGKAISPDHPSKWSL